MKILVTGAAGMLGSAVRKHAPNFAFDSDVDLINPKKTKVLIAAHKPEVIIHCAAVVGGFARNRDYPTKMYYDNMIMNANMVQEAAKQGVKRFIGFGSNCAYGDVKELCSTNVFEGMPFVNNAPYGFAKRMLLVHLQAAKQEYGMDYTYFVPPTMYGLHDQFSLANGHVVANLIHKCHLGEMRVWGNGSAVREVAFADDIAKIVLEMKDDGVCVLGSGQHVSIKEMVQSIVKHMQYTDEVIWETDKPNGQLVRPPMKIRDFAFTPFNEGIRQTCEWFKKEYPNVRGV